MDTDFAGKVRLTHRLLSSSVPMLSKEFLTKEVPQPFKQDLKEILIQLWTTVQKKNCLWVLETELAKKKRLLKWLLKKISMGIEQRVIAN